MKKSLIIPIIIIISSCSSIDDKNMKHRKVRTSDNIPKPDKANLEHSLLETNSKPKGNRAKHLINNNKNFVIIDNDQIHNNDPLPSKPPKVIFNLHKLLTPRLDHNTPRADKKEEALTNKKVDGVALLPKEFEENHQSLYQKCEERFDELILNRIRNILDPSRSPGKYILKPNPQSPPNNFTVTLYSLDHISNSCCSLCPNDGSLALKAIHGIILNQEKCHCLLKGKNIYSKNECISCNYSELALVSIKGQVNCCGIASDLELCINDLKDIELSSGIDENELSDFISLDIIKVIIPKKGYTSNFDKEHDLLTQSLDELYGHPTAINIADTMIQSGKERVYYRSLNEFQWAGPLGNIPCNAYPSSDKCSILRGCSLYNTKTWVDYFLHNKVLMLSKTPTIVETNNSNFIYDENNQIIAQTKIIYRFIINGQVIVSCPRRSNWDITKDFFNPYI